MHYQQIALITLPSDFTSGIASNTSALASDFSPYLTLVLGILLLAVVVEIIIGALKKH